MNQALQANEKADGGNFEVDFKTGSTLILYHREARGRQRFVSSYTGESLEEYQLAAAEQTATYRMTDKGLMQDDWSKEKQMQVYLQSLEQYSAFLMSHITKAEIADSEKFIMKRQHFCLHMKKLESRQQRSISEQLRYSDRTETGSLLWLHTDRTGAFKRKC